MRTRTGPPPALLAGIALLAAGCGGSSSPGVAHLGSATTSSTGASGSAEPGGAGPASPSGGGPAGGGAQSSATIAGGANQQQMVAFSKCMRTHGEPDFPEPVEGRLVIHGSPNSGLDPGSAQFQSAMRSCQSMAPRGGPASPAQSAEFQAKALKFSACMRTHGVPGFPDPVISGNGIRLTLNKASGIDPRSPQFQAAQRACQSLMPLPPGGGRTDGPEGGP
jgi:hypothetical protein